MKIYEELEARGLIAQVTDEEEIRELVNTGKAVFYIGFDPTADSLHVGHFMALSLMKRLQMAGNKPIVLLGGGTGLIGDPSGRTDMRTMMDQDTIQHNIDCFKKQMERFIEFGEGKAIMVNNADWLAQLNYVDLLREVGVHFSVNNMLRAECYKQRMEKGLSFLELNYMIMQSFDFYYLYQEYGCNMQFGGDDQWSNMLGGTDLIRRKLGEDAYAMTITLLLNAEGSKMGKTAKGAVWLDPNKTSPFDFYQYWRNVDDADVLKCIRLLTFLPLAKIDAMDGWTGSQLNEAKEILAFELTKLVHGEDEAQKSQDTAHALFGGGADDSNMPSTVITADKLTGGAIGLVDLLTLCGLTKSKSDARRVVEQGGVLVNDTKTLSIDDKITSGQLKAGIVIRKGKKTFHKVSLLSASAAKASGKALNKQPDAAKSSAKVVKKKGDEAVSKAVQAGDAVPKTALPASNGKEVKLSDFKGQKVVLYIYPKDLSSGCSTESLDFKKRAEEFEQADTVILGLSKDSLESHQKFIDKLKLPFLLLSDVDMKLINAFGAWQEKNRFGKMSYGVERTTVLIDTKGKVRKIYPNVKVKGHAEQILKDIREL